MAIVHGNWIKQNQSGCLFIWGETWRLLTPESPSLVDVFMYPLGMAPR